ncbi:hypothetical protein [Nitrosococcus watsonii]|uniref:Uncharacterized protein n=1 Tax=Nitrosococcus watsoni (strain C-113) TaxID=105559 RepID=D8K791_NITWC|nr:hypothetical protein [Nitrosococcus watsonii]ADJ28768.1 conserved hypothetical protein [Nitrosococcus watsonii C-113]
MSLTEESQLRSVTGITEEQKMNIVNFLQGAVYCWCKNRKDEWFSLRDLMGEDNYYWEGTPLLPLYIKHEGANDDPVKEAGKDAGWLLKEVVANDKRVFDTKKESLIRHYRWVPSE